MKPPVPPSPSNLSIAGLAAALRDEALRNASSPTLFERGTTYARSGAVTLIEASLDGPVPAVRATVDGTQAYATEIRVPADGEVEGDCSCPHAEDGWFCKHQVAVALVWRDRLLGVAPAIDDTARRKVAASAKRAQTLQAQRQALEAFLRAQPAAALAERLLAWAERDRDIAAELQQWRELAEAPARPAALKPLVTKMLSCGRGFLDRRDSRAFAQRAQAVLPLLAQARATDAAAATGLALHALRRGWAILTTQADDSDGEIGALVHQIGAEWVQALEQAGPQPAAFGETLLDLMFEDPFGCFDKNAALAAIGPAAQARYRQALAARWRAAPAPDAAGQRAGFDMGRWQLERLYLAVLEAEGDIDAAQAVLREDLSGPLRHLQLAELLERHGRLREAFAAIEQGSRAFPADDRLQEALLRCYDRDGWADEALALRRRRFEESPVPERYHALLRTAAAAGHDAAALREELLALLASREARAVSSGVPRFRRLDATTSPGEPALRDVSARAALLCSEQHWAEAQALVQPPALCRNPVLVELAEGLAPTEPASAAALLMRVLDAEMLSAKSPYHRELGRAAQIARLLEPGERQRWLQMLQRRFQAKRNFVAGLPAD